MNRLCETVQDCLSEHLNSKIYYLSISTEINEFDYNQWLSDGFFLPKWWQQWRQKVRAKLW